MTIHIPINDSRVHVLAISDGGPDIPEQTYLTGPALEAEPLMRALGAEVAAEHVEVFKIKDLLPLSLREYLHQAHDIPKDAFASDMGRLDGLDGAVIVLAPAALRGVAGLNPQPHLTHVGAYGAPVPDDTPQPLPKAVRQRALSESGKPTAAGRSRLPLRVIVLLALLAAAGLILLF